MKKNELTENEKIWREWKAVNGTALSGQVKFMESLPEPDRWSVRQKEVALDIIDQNKQFRDEVEDGLDIDLYGFCD